MAPEAALGLDADEGYISPPESHSPPGGIAIYILNL